MIIKSRWEMGILLMNIVGVKEKMIFINHR